MTGRVLEPREITLEIPGFCLAGKAWGHSEGQPVLALHGWLDNAASFDALAPWLPELRLVALDLPGHGFSQHRAPGQEYHFVDWLPVVFEAADALGWQRFALMGHSMGAAIASLAAGVCAERISRLVLIEGLGPTVGEDSDVPVRIAKNIRQRARGGRPAKPYPSQEDAATRLTMALADLSLASARRLVERGTQPIEGGVTWRSDPRLQRVSPHPFNEAQVHAFLRRISAPTLAIVADAGGQFDRERMENRCACIQALRIERVSGGHHVHLEHPSRVAPSLRRHFELD
jgi:pimeloyl-ACP methyl ester carboxylesterase